MKIRLFTAQNLAQGSSFGLDRKQGHYLRNVLRVKDGDLVFVFNNQDGEFEARVRVDGKDVQLSPIKKTQDYYQVPDICLAFAPVKNVKAEHIAVKATELGVRAICPVITERTIVNKVNLEKMKVNSIEAAEQCERTDLPVVNDAVLLKSFLKSLKTENLVLADESGDGLIPEKLFKKINIKERTYILIGPEGGFSDSEREIIKSYKNSFSLIIGPRILRADTAIMTSLAYAQNYLGDIVKPPSFA